MIRAALPLALAALPALAVPTGEVRLVSVVTGQPEPILAATLDANRRAACLSTPLSLALLSETYRIADDARPTPAALPCFDAARLSADLAEGRAVAFLSDPGPGPLRLVAVYPDGRAYAWQQPHLTEK
ncbi:histidine kinase [Candidatus Falkowbacteria bacterium]|nr:histidine kinase [Candidatus Falkowbacteria bacterium]